MGARSPIAVEVHCLRGGIFDIQGSFSAPATAACAWSVLTDYGHLGRFVPSILLSHVQSTDGDSLQVLQEISGRFLIFTRTLRVLLDIHEKPEHSISFTDVSGRDFAFYRGDWALRDGSGSVDVRYEAQAKPRTFPPFWADSLFADAARSQLEAVRAEILRRSRQHAS